MYKLIHLFAINAFGCSKWINYRPISSHYSNYISYSRHSVTTFFDDYNPKGKRNVVLLIALLQYPKVELDCTGGDNFVRQWTKIVVQCNLL